MTISRVEVKAVTRTEHTTAVGAAAYRSGSAMTMTTTETVTVTSTDAAPTEIEKTRRFDYTKKSAVHSTDIIAPPGTPDYLTHREQLWNAVEHAERRKDSQLFREVLISLPVELTLEQARAAVCAYARDEFVAAGMIADVCVHGDAGNPHAHVMLTMRRVVDSKFGKKERAWNDKKLVPKWRASWQEHANRALAAAGSDARVDMRSLRDQGIARAPLPKVSRRAWREMQRGDFSHPGAREYQAAVQFNQGMSDDRAALSNIVGERNQFDQITALARAGLVEQIKIAQRNEQAAARAPERPVRELRPTRVTEQAAPAPEIESPAPEKPVETPPPATDRSAQIAAADRKKRAAAAKEKEERVRSAERQAADDLAAFKSLTPGDIVAHGQVVGMGKIIHATATKDGRIYHAGAGADDLARFAKRVADYGKIAVGAIIDLGAGAADAVKALLGRARGIGR